MKQAGTIWLPAVLGMFVAACSSCSDGSSGVKDAGVRVCEPGAAEDCFCPSGNGAKKCKSDGSGWDECQCSGGDADTDGDADGDTDTDTGGDADGDSDPDCGPNTNGLTWIRNPPGIDCGPGCRQLTFEEINPVVEWSASEEYVAASANATGNALVVDIEKDCYAYLDHPNPSKGTLVYTYPWVSDRKVSYLASFWISSTLKTEVVIFDMIDGIWQHMLSKEQSMASVTFFRYPSFDNDTIAYLQQAEDGKDDQVKLYNMVSKVESTISNTNSKRSIFRTRHEGDYVVWEDVTLIPTDIYAYQISTGQTWNLSNHERDQLSPRIDNGRVVWLDYRNGGGGYWGSQENADVYLYDLAEEKLVRITDKPWIQAYPDISGDRIVWQDNRANKDPNDKYDFSNVDIWMYDMSSGKEYQITDHDGAETYPQIIGDKVFYYHRPPGENYNAIFMQDLKNREQEHITRGKSL